MKKIWIFNHYATDMYVDVGGRHYWFAKYLLKDGYKPTIFCANTFHNMNKKIEISKGNYTIKELNGIEFVFVKTCTSIGNGFKRILNMLLFYKNIFKVSKDILKNGKPDIILASSVHPLTLVAGIKIAKKLKIPCICEVRDLWPESLVAYGKVSKRNIITKLMYVGEKWIYKNCDRLIMTWSGGYDYIKDRKWDKEILSSKVKVISNGVDLDDFNYLRDNFIIDDPDLKSNGFTVVYTGSIRMVNNLNIIVKVAEILKNRGIKAKLLIWGDGTEKEELENYVIKEGLDNIVFKGRVEKKYIPYILSNSKLCLLHNSSTTLDKYGQSQNKFFEYLASGKPILMTYSVGHSICRNEKCGIEIDNQTPEEIAGAIEWFVKIPENDYAAYAIQAKLASKKYDYKVMTQNLINIIEEII